jgi:hypothetical protein
MTGERQTSVTIQARIGDRLYYQPPGLKDTPQFARESHV